MTLSFNPNVLSQLSELKEEVRNNFLVEKLQNQGFEQSLQRLYKPILDSKVEIIKHITDISNKNNTNWLEFKSIFSNFPDLVRNIDDIKKSLDVKANDLINEVKSTNEINKEIVERIDNLNTSFQELNRMITKPEKLVKMFEKGEISSGIGTADIESSVEEIQPTEKIKSFLETEESLNPITLVNYLASYSSKSFSKEAIDSKYKEVLEDPTKRDVLKNFVEYNKEKVKFSTNPWSTISRLDPEFYAELQILKSKNGKGIKKGMGITKVIIPSDDESLMNEFKRLLGSYKSGNTAVYNELEAVVDELRRKGKISLKQSKKLYKEISY